MDWDLTSYFDAFGSENYHAFKSQLTSDIDALALAVEAAGPITQANLADWAGLLVDLEGLSTRLSHIRSYIGCLAAAEASNEDYAGEEAALSLIGAQRDKALNLVKTELGMVDDKVFRGLLEDPRLKGAGYRLERLREEARYAMPREQEELASDLGINGIDAWSRLYFALSGNLKFKLEEPDGTVKDVPMAQRVSLLSSPDRDLRRRAFEGSNAAWHEHRHTAASALNAIAGSRLTLDKRRGVEHFLDIACRDAAISRQTLDALFTALESRREFARSVLELRSEQMGIGKAASWDLLAPLELPETKALSWEEGSTLVQDAFDAAYPKLGTFYREIVEKRWIDYTPRDDKRPGGFCSSSQLTRESRIFMTFKDTMNAVMTLAHEAGHAWHTRVLSGQRSSASTYPMTLAESASTFAEMILSDGVLSDDRFSAGQKLEILDADTTRIVAFLLDIPTRFLFEKRFYEERSKGMIPVSRIQNLMTEAQREVFGDSLQDGAEDPFFWASKLHFFIDSVRFYNFPYTFGYLLSVSLFARFKQEGRAFLEDYERLLELSGSADCESVVQKSLGENLADPSFWTRAIDHLKGPVDQLQGLLAPAE